MRMKAGVALEAWGIGMLFLVLLPARAVCQSKQVPTLRLSVTDIVPVEGATANSMLFPIRSDSKGNVYFRFFEAINGLRVPVVRVSSDGQKTTTFALPAAGFHDADINGFAVTPDGAVALAVFGKGPNQKTKFGRGYILKFNSDGTFDSAIQLGKETLLQIGIFQNGNLLVSGVKDARLYGKNEPPVSVPFTEILDDVGNLLKQLTLPDDIKPAKPSDADFLKEEGEVPPALSTGDAVSGSDGNLYLMRHTSLPKIYVISPDGVILRALNLKPPAGTQSWGGLQYDSEDGGELALWFEVKNNDDTNSSRIISLYSAETGERVLDYIAPPSVGVALASCSPNGFLFLGSNPQHQLVLKQVNAN